MINQMLDVLAYEDHNVLDFETVQVFLAPVMYHVIFCL